MAQRLEIDSHINGQLIYDRCGAACEWGEDIRISTRPTGSPHGKMKLEPASYHTQKPIPNGGQT